MSNIIWFRKELMGQPVNYIMNSGKYFALIVQITTSKLYLPKIYKISKLPFPIFRNMDISSLVIV